MPANFSFTTYYAGSCNSTTYLRSSALDRLDVLVFAAHYEGTAGCFIHMDASRLGSIVVTTDYGAVLKAFSRAEALAAHAVGRMIAAASLLVARPPETKNQAKARRARARRAARRA